MSKGASKTMIGGFVVGAAALLIIAVLIFGSGKFFSKQNRYVMFFKESVNGLTVGSPVVFRGVTIGSVVRIELWAYPKELRVLIPVYVEVDPAKFKEKNEGVSGDGSYLKQMIQKGLRAQIKMQSIVTGQLMIYADYYPDKPLDLIGADPDYPEIPTIPSGVEELKATLEKIPLEEIVKKAHDTLDGIDRLVNSPETKTMISNLNEAVGEIKKASFKLDSGLDRSAAAIQDIQKLVRDVNVQIDPLSKEIRGTLADTRSVIKKVDEQIAPISGDLKNTLKEAAITLAEAQKALKKAGDTISGESVISAELIRSLEELNRTSRSVQDLTDFLKRHPESLLWGKKQGGGK
ncbi:MAG TPA: MlaD family protein [Thermodesulfobacteriota bacterium]|nr:MlaD family protein [Thermodesulfobacteriota bacterium]